MKKSKRKKKPKKSKKALPESKVHKKKYEDDDTSTERPRKKKDRSERKVKNDQTMKKQKVTRGKEDVKDSESEEEKVMTQTHNPVHKSSSAKPLDCEDDLTSQRSKRPQTAQIFLSQARPSEDGELGDRRGQSGSSSNKEGFFNFETKVEVPDHIKQDIDKLIEQVKDNLENLSPSQQMQPEVQDMGNEAI